MQGHTLLFRKYAKSRNIGGSLMLMSSYVQVKWGKKIKGVFDCCNASFACFSSLLKYPRTGKLCFIPSIIIEMPCAFHSILRLACRHNHGGIFKQSVNSTFSSLISCLMPLTANNSSFCQRGCLIGHLCSPTIASFKLSANTSIGQYSLSDPYHFLHRNCQVAQLPDHVIGPRRQTWD